MKATGSPLDPRTLKYPWGGLWPPDTMMSSAAGLVSL